MNNVDKSRFYENEFPEVGDLVVVQVTRLESHNGAYVSLLEYGGLEGLILPTELSKRRFRSIHKLIKIRRQEIVMVLRLDPVKKYVDLSKKRVAVEDIAATESKFIKSKKVHLIAREVANKLNMTIDDICKQAIWPLYKKYNHAHDAFELALEQGIQVFNEINCDPKISAVLLEIIQIRMTAQPLRVRAKVHVSTYAVEGIDALKNSFKAAEKHVENEDPDKFSMKCQLIAAPIYSILVSSNDKNYCIPKFKEVLAIIEAEITKTEGGIFKQIGEITINNADDVAVGNNNEGNFDNESSTESDSDDESDEDDGESSRNSK